MEQIMEEYGISVVLILVGTAVIKALAGIFSLF